MWKAEASTTGGAAVVQGEEKAGLVTDGYTEFWWNIFLFS
jgi:hypothetical protein